MRQQIKEALVYLRHAISPDFDARSIVARNAEHIGDAFDEEFETHLIQRISDAYRATVRDQRNVPVQYRAGGFWNEYASTVQEFISAAQDQNLEDLRRLLRNFIRSPASSGMFPNPLRAAWRPAAVNNIAIWLHDAEFLAKRGNFTLIDCATAPRFGNPLGFVTGETFVMWSAPGHKYYATRVADVIREIPVPIILEIGGGFGGMASFLIPTLAGCYIDLDLPEQIMISSYYLGMAFPTKRLCLYGEVDCGSADSLRNAEITLLPNFCLPQIPSNFATLTVNVASLSEMDRCTVEEYVAQIARITTDYFFHDNSDRAVMRDNQHVEIPASQFGLEKYDFELVLRESKSGMSQTSTRNVLEIFQRKRTS